MTLFRGEANLFCINDLSFFDEKIAKLRHVTKNNTTKTVVVLTSSVLVCAPKRDSAEENCSVNPPPFPDCIRMTPANKIQIKA